MKTVLLAVLGLSTATLAQPEPQQSPRPGEGPRGPGGPGGMMMQDREIAHRFDTNNDGKLSKEERAEARKFMKEEAARRPMRGGRGPGGGGPGGPGGGGPGGFGPPGMERESGKPGVHVDKSEVKPMSGGLYDENVFRTFFLDFENDDWEAELGDFIRSDVEVPATMTVDGKVYKEVGVGFRGASSLMMVPAGSKRSFNISMDYGDKRQRLMGSKTLNLLNSNGDPSLMRAVLYFHIAKQLGIPAPRANFVRVVVNGENWGVYQNVQQFDALFLKDHFKAENGARWKVPGSPQGRGGLEYIGDDIEAYRRKYDIKSKDSDESWHALIKLCRTLNETPADQLEAAIKPMLDVEGALWFLALENTLQNEDGYWVRASDYSIYLDEKGVFHILPHDANEAFLPGGGGPGRGGQRRPGGPGGGQGGGPGGPDGPGGPPEDRRPDRVGNQPGEQPESRQPEQGRQPQRNPGQVDPLIGLEDSTKPLRSKLLKVPAFRESYLRKVRTIATDWLDWSKLGPVAEKYRALIEKDVEIDTRKLSSNQSFKQAFAAPAQVEGEARPGRSRPSLEQFAKQRRDYLLGLPAIKELDATKK